MPRKPRIKATIQKIVENPGKTPYAIATSEDVLPGDITFLLIPSVWTEEEWPKEGQNILVGRMYRNGSGWRAMFARYWTQKDEDAWTK